MANKFPFGSYILPKTLLLIEEILLYEYQTTPEQIHLY